MSRAEILPEGIIRWRDRIERPLLSIDIAATVVRLVPNADVLRQEFVEQLQARDAE
jgi:hypothetical protein